MRRSTLRRLPVLALAGLACACGSTKPPGSVENPRLPTEQFAAKVTTAPEEIRLAVHAQGLSPTQAGALAGFVDGWREAGGGMIRIQSPASGPEAAATYRTGEGARNFLVSRGVPEQAIEVVGYEAQGAANAPIVVGYERSTVEVPKCGQVWGNFAHSAFNRPQSNFGCAVTANIAAQVANPADLLGPRPVDPADAQRRMTVIGKYRLGEPTNSERDASADGVVSEAVN